MEGKLICYANDIEMHKPAIHLRKNHPPSLESGDLMNQKFAKQR